jgi:hypothetical protein
VLGIIEFSKGADLELRNLSEVCAKVTETSVQDPLTPPSPEPPIHVIHGAGLSGLAVIEHKKH